MKSKIVGAALAGAAVLLTVTPAQADVYRYFTGVGEHVNSNTAYDIADKAARDKVAAARCALQNSPSTESYAAPGNLRGWRITYPAWCPDGTA